MTALLALTAFVPAAIADGDRKEIKEDRKEIKEDRKELREDKKELRDDLKAYVLKHRLHGNTTLELSGSGVGRDNATYKFTLEASGKGLERFNRDGELRALRGYMLAHVVIYNETGDVVKDGDMRLKVFARLTDDGEWKWQVQSWGKRADGMPRLVLRGDAEKLQPGVFQLDGAGHMTVKMDGDERSTPIKVNDVSGTFTRELRPALTPAAAA